MSLVRGMGDREKGTFMGVGEINYFLLNDSFNGHTDTVDEGRLFCGHFNNTKGEAAFLFFFFSVCCPSGNSGPYILFTQSQVMGRPLAEGVVVVGGDVKFLSLII